MARLSLQALTLETNGHTLSSTGAPVVSRQPAGRRGFVSSARLRIGGAFLLVVVAAACTPSEPELSPTRSPSLTARPSPTRAPTRTPSSTSTPTAPPCLSQPGEIRAGELDDPALFRHLPYRIYLPACYTEWPDARFPTLYLLHGLQATDAQWDDIGIDEAADRLIATGEITPLLIVMPWERRGLDYAPAIAEILVPWIDRSFRTVASAEGRAIGGLSRGAGWALRIAFQHPGLFSSLGLHSPAALSPDLYNLPFWLEALPSDEFPRIWVDIGDRDSLRASTLELIDLFDQADVTYEWHPNQGYHAPEYWSSHLEEYLMWYSLGWD